MVTRDHRSRLTRWLVGVVAVGCAAFLIAAAVLADRALPAPGVKVAVVDSARYGSVLVVGSGPLRGFPLYEFSGDAGRHYGCGVALALGSDIGAAATDEMTCTGPMDDLENSVTSDDWPALTSSHHPVAGRGVRAALLSTVYRAGIGDQVTYAGHPLYLFDPSSAPFAPQGVRYPETVHPFAPWHGIWYLVSAATGAPVAGPARVEAGRLADGRRALTVEVDANIEPLEFAVYAFSRDSPTASTCTGACARTWLPVITTGRPVAGPGVSPSALGVVARADGTSQVTFEGRPLYLYAAESPAVVGHSLLRTGTVGNGAGRRWGSGEFSLVTP